MNNVVTPEFADFPTSEYVSRYERMQREMKSSGLDAMIIVQRENIEYFSGFMTGHWPSKTFNSAGMILRATGAPILITPDFFSGTARKTSWVADVRYFDEPHGKPEGFRELIVSLIRELGLSTGTVALEYGTNLQSTWNLADLDHVRAALSSATMVPADVELWKCRSIKSPAEIERMRFITLVTERAITGALDRFGVGATELDLSRSILEIGMAAGADGVTFTNIRAGLSRYPCADVLPADRKLERDEIMVVDIGLKYHTYTSDIAYVVNAGPASDLKRRMYDAIIDSQQAMLRMLRPGVSTRELFMAGNKVLTDFGYGKTIDLIGHGIGLDVHEPPIITPYADYTLEAGMVLAIEPWLYDPESQGVFCVEEIVAVTEDGFEMISTIPRDELRIVD